MKTNVIIIALLAIGLYANAQEYFATYDNTYVDQSYDVELEINDNGSFVMYVNALSLDEFSEAGGFMITEEQHEKFIRSLEEAKVIYLQWLSIAKENNVKEFSKNMDVSCKTSGYFRYGQFWKFHFNKNINFNFRVINSDGDIDYVLIVKTGRLTASSNQYIDTDGLVLVFTDAEEIDSFIQLISSEAVNAYRNAPKTSDLFQ